MPKDKSIDAKKTPEKQGEIKAFEKKDKSIVQEVSAEKISVPEKKVDIHKEDENPKLDHEEVVSKKRSEPVTTPDVAQVNNIDDNQIKKRIEGILEEDLSDFYASLSPDKQIQFRLKGEETVSKIMAVVSKTRVNARKIFKLIKVWLKTIPGVNRFFLEQEAKIKTDKILHVTDTDD
jgi:hypothetical protein